MTSRSGPLKRLLGLVWTHRGECVLIIFLQVLILSLAMGGLALSGVGIDVIRHELDPAAPTARFPFGFALPALHGMPLVGFVAGLILALAIIRLGFNIFYTRRVADLVQGRIVVDLRNGLYEKLQRLDFRFFDANASGALINRLTGDVQSVRLFVDGVVIQSAIMAISLGVYLIYMLNIHIGLTLACLAATPLLLVVSVAFSRIVRPRYLDHRRRVDRLVLWLTETVRGITVIKAFAQESMARERFEAANDSVREQQFAIHRVLSFYAPSVNGITQINLVILLAYGGWLVIHNEVALGSGLVVFAGILQQFSGQIASIATIMNSAQQSIAAAERIFEVIDEPAAIASGPDARPLTTSTGRIVFDDVTFAYGPGLPPALDHVTFTAEPGQFVGIIGPTGAGKSTLLSLIPRFYDPDSGEIRIDDLNVRDLDLGDLRHRIGLVFQESFLFSATIAENIAFGHPAASRDEIERAARTAAADLFIEALRDGYDSRLHEGGVSLSGGQRQRLALARAVLSDPAILILDDPTAAVDTETEREILKGIERARRGRTVFIATHRLAALRGASLLISLDAGRVVQIGTPGELAAAPGYYRTLLQLERDDDV